MASHRHHQLDRQLQSLFERCPELCGFAVRGDERELFVSDIGVSPRLSREQFDQIFEDISQTLASLLEERPEVSEWLRGRTFARTLH